MASRYKITVVITSYNLGNYMEQCLEDLYHQTFQDFLILIVDDNSTDNTKDIIKKWQKIYGGRLALISLEQNLGMPAMVRNVAMDSGKINGEYTVFLDGDDRLEICFLETLYYLAVKKNADVAICAYDRVDEISGKSFSTEMTRFDGIVVDDIFRSDLIAFVNTSPWNKLWKTEIIRELRYPEIRVGEEVSFNFQGYVKCRRIAFTGDVLIHYLVRKESVISNTDAESIWSLEKELRNLYNVFGAEEKKIMGLLIFFHIGLSMALRAADNPDIELGDYIKRIRSLFKQEYDWFMNNNLLHINNLIRHGLKGIGIWCAFVAYRMNLFWVVLKIYRELGLHIKF